MTRAFLIVAVSAPLFLASPVLGQRALIGAKAGWLSATMDTDGALPASARTSVALGASAVLRIARSFALQPELLYAEKGMELTAGEGLALVDVAYLSFPVPVRLSIPARWRVRPYVVAGPTVGLRLSCSVSEHEPGREAFADCGDADVFRTTPLDLGVVGGAGLSFAHSSGEITVELRYDRGLSNIYDGPAALRVRTRSLLILVGAATRLGF